MCHQLSWQKLLSNFLQRVHHTDPTCQYIFTTPNPPPPPPPTPPQKKKKKKKKKNEEDEAKQMQ
jgi:hypothetical protein